MIDEECINCGKNVNGREEYFMSDECGNGYIIFCSRKCARTYIKKNLDNFYDSQSD